MILPWGIPRKEYLPNLKHHNPDINQLFSYEIHSLKAHLKDALELRASLKRVERGSDDFIDEYFNDAVLVITLEELKEEIALNRDSYLNFFDIFNSHEKIINFQRALVQPIMDEETSTCDVAKEYFLDEEVIEVILMSST